MQEIRRMLWAKVRFRQQSCPGRIDVNLETTATQNLEGLYTTDRKGYRVLKSATDFIENRLNRQISITEIGQAAATSVSNLERAFRAELVTSPGRNILLRKLERVQKALIRTRRGERRYCCARQRARRGKAPAPCRKPDSCSRMDLLYILSLVNIPALAP
jgi:AraC-like DNA-binding protein